MVEIKNIRGAVIHTFQEDSLRGADLCGADLVEADLRGGNLSDADLRGASLYGANLSRADLSRADLNRANLRRAALREAYLNRADLSRADMNEADLCGADLREARLSWSSHTLLSEILWRAAGTEPRKMLAAYVGRREDWCWGDWAKFCHPEKGWALRELARWIHAKDADEDVPALVWAARESEAA
jgi:hypothetical protein